jgi:hypothetical protein
MNGKAALKPSAMKMYALHGLHFGVLAPGSMHAKKQQSEETLMRAKNLSLMWNVSLQVKQ